MKKLYAMLFTAVLCLSMGMSALAAGSPQGGATALTADGVSATITSVNKELADSVTPAKVAEVVKPASNQKAELLGLVEVSVDPKDRDADGSVTLTFNVNGVKAGENIVVIHYNNDKAEWEVVPTLKVEDGKITAKFTSLSPVGFVRVSASSASAATSPKTGEANAIVLVELLVVVCAATALYAGKRAKVSR